MATQEAIVLNIGWAESVTSASGAFIAVKIFVEQQVIAPPRIPLKFFGAAKYWPPTFSSRNKDACQAIDDFAGNLEQVHQLARADRALHPAASKKLKA